MKKLAGVLVVLISLLMQAHVFADEKNDISSKSDIEKAILIEKYLVSHKSKIEKFTQKYKLEKNDQIKRKIERLNYLIKGINKVKNEEINKEKNKTVIIEILKEIKTINDELKVLLVEEKNKHEEIIIKKQKQYTILAEKIAGELERINNALHKKYIDGKVVLSLKESNINKSVKKLDKEIKKLKYFGKIKFTSENEMKQSFLRILRSIKTEMKTVKNTIKRA